MYKLKNGMNVEWITESKFNEVVINLRVFFPLENFNRTLANLLSKIMDDRLEKNPTKESMTRRLDLLYGLKTNVKTYALGNYQILDIQAYGINERFVDEPLLMKQIELVSEILSNSLINEDSLKEAKKRMIDQHKRLQENPSQKALLNAFSHAGKSQVLGLTSMGDINDLDKITVKTLLSFKENVINKFSKSLVIVGDVEKIDLEPLFTSVSSSNFDLAYHQAIIKPNYIEEFHKGSQTELVLIYETNIKPGSYDAIKLMVYTAYLGQLPTSLLFQQVREKHSLCYSINARQFIFDGIMVIQTGIADKNIDLTLKIVKEQVELMKKNIEDLDFVKKALIARLNNSKESLGALSSRSFSNLLSHNHKSIDDLKEEINNVTEEEVLELAKLFNNPYVYAYRGEEN